MVTTVTKTRERVTTVTTKLGGNGFGARGGRGLPPTGPPGGGGGDNNRDNTDHDGSQNDVSGLYRVGIWLALAAVFMLFASLMVAYLFLAQQKEWRPLTVPHVLWVSTSLILLSSLTFEAARASLRRGRDQKYRAWLAVSLLLGVAFLAAQSDAWWQLAAQGVYLASNPHSSLFYILTGAHAVHLFGGILALTALLIRAVMRRHQWFDAHRSPATDAVALYWHFMDGLWICLFVLLLFW
jgi:cytochrome c oxidase subunit 3